MADINHAFDELVTEALKAPFEGWDFSFLDGRRSESPLPWDYISIARQCMLNAHSMLDIGTGGGEILSSLAPFPEKTCATECYAPNIRIAKRRLEPLEVKVYDTSADQENRHLPFRNEEFELIINRHESFVPRELSRILEPKGIFLTQQSGGYGENDLVEWFKGKGKAEPIDWTAATACRELRAVGFKILDSQEIYSKSIFADVGAVVYYLKAIPWLVDDFSVEKYHGRLLDMHEHIKRHGGFEVTDQRFLIKAIRK